MDAIGMLQSVISQPLTGSTGASPGNAGPAPSVHEAPVIHAGTSGFNVEASEQKRFEAVQRAAQDIANIYIVSDRRFTIFKDTTGQYITRFTSLRDGKVTYIPEPELFRMAQSSAPSLLKIEA